MRRRDSFERLTIRQTLSQLGVGDLKPLVILLQGRAQGRKADLVEVVARTLENRERVRALYDTLDELGKRAVEEAAHDAEGTLHRQRFQAKYGEPPTFGGAGVRRDQPRPTQLRLFFPRSLTLPRDLQDTLLSFVPEPLPLTVHAMEELPVRVRRPHKDWGSSYWKPNQEEIEPRVRETARVALHDVKAVLRLIDAGGVRVGERTGRPSQTTMKAVQGVLADGDFYGESEQSKHTWDPAADLAVRAFAWQLLVQAAGLARFRAPSYN